MPLSRIVIEERRVRNLQRRHESASPCLLADKRLQRYGRLAVFGNEEIGRQVLARVNAIMVELTLAILPKQRVVDAKVARELARRLCGMTCEASARISAFRLARISLSPPSKFATAAVAIVVRGHKALTAIPSRFSSAASPQHTEAHIIWRLCRRREAQTTAGLRSSGGESMRICGFSAFLR